MHSPRAAEPCRYAAHGARDEQGKTALPYSIFPFTRRVHGTKNEL